MPTYEEDPRFTDDWNRLTREQQADFLAALADVIADADSGMFRGSLRAHPMRRHAGIWEMTWEGNDGRATFSFGPEQVPGKRHIIWRRIGTHRIYDNP